MATDPRKHFKILAAKKRAEAAKLAPPDAEKERLPDMLPSEIAAANKASPAVVAGLVGEAIAEWQGRHGKLSDKARFTVGETGTVAWNPGGNNIAYVRSKHPQWSFPAVVKALLAPDDVPGYVAAVTPGRQAALPQGGENQGGREGADLRRPSLPPMREAEAGQAYLRGRGIAQPVLEAAERQGFLRYVSGAVFYVGRDSAGDARLVTKRGYAVGDAQPKRDLFNSSKAYAPVLAGTPSEVWVVEGGTDALALHTMRLQANQPLPTVVVSGGADVRQWLKTPHLQAILLAAERIVVAAEREKDAETQAKTDAARAQQIAEIQALGCVAPELFMPRSKDLAADLEIADCPF